MRAHSPNNPRAPLVLACGFPVLIAWSGVRPKLAALTNLSGTNLDTGGARRVSGMDATNQKLAVRHPDQAALLVNTKGDSWCSSQQLGSCFKIEIVWFRQLNPTDP
tara:strand:- start:340 stop:657 length:318 start_codon:yes stop_codon:yes gene_type:complete